MTTNNAAILIPRPSPASGLQPSELTVTWRTPLGLMTGRVGANGVRSLRFPDPAARTIPGTADGPVRSPAAHAAPFVEIDSRTLAVGGEPRADDPALPLVRALTEFLRGYFAGDSAARAPRLDYGEAGPFQRAVWEATRRIPRGATATYGQIAARIGKPGAARAVGGALGRNPLVLLVPCHRVISAAAGPKALCGFTGGLDLKKHLLALEGIECS